MLRPRRDGRLRSGSAARHGGDHIAYGVDAGKFNRKLSRKIKLVIDDILKFKSLLDAGVITQAEFDAKKKQLLGI